VYIARTNDLAVQRMAAAGRPIYTRGRRGSRLAPSMVWIGLAMSHFAHDKIMTGLVFLVMTACVVLMVQSLRGRKPTARRQQARFDRMVAANQIVAVPDVLSKALADSADRFKLRINVQVVLQDNPTDVEYLTGNVVPMLTDTKLTEQTRQEARDQIANCMDGICNLIRERKRLQDEEEARERELYDFGQRAQLGIYPRVNPSADESQ